MFISGLSEIIFSAVTLVTSLLLSGRIFKFLKQQILALPTRAMYPSISVSPSSQLIGAGSDSPSAPVTDIVTVLYSTVSFRV